MKPTTRQTAARALTAAIVSLTMSLPLLAQAATKLQLLGYHYAKARNELTLGLFSLSEKTNPQILENRRIKVRLVSGGGQQFDVPTEDLKFAYPGEYLRPEHRLTLLRFNILIDESNSIADGDLQQVRNTVAAFLEKLPPNYEAQIIRFSSELAVSPFMTEAAQIKSVLRAPRLAGKTALFDALDRAALELSQSADNVAFKFCIAFTDGKENASSLYKDADTFRTHWNAVAERKMIFLALAGVGDDVDSVGLRKLTEGAPIPYMKLANLKELKQLFETVLGLIKNSYTVTIPLSTEFQKLKKVFIMRIADRNYDRAETLQEIDICQDFSEGGSGDPCQ